MCQDLRSKCRYLLGRVVRWTCSGGTYLTFPKELRQLSKLSRSSWSGKLQRRLPARFLGLQHNIGKECWKMPWKDEPQLRKKRRWLQNISGSKCSQTTLPSWIVGWRQLSRWYCLWWHLTDWQCIMSPIKAHWVSCCKRRRTESKCQVQRGLQWCRRLFCRFPYYQPSSCLVLNE